MKNGTDAPVEDVDPITNYYTTITHTMKNGNMSLRTTHMIASRLPAPYTIDTAKGSVLRGFEREH